MALMTIANCRGRHEENTMEATIHIPVEARAAVECNALFDALKAGDYPAAARAQERLRDLGWEVRRTSSEPPSRRKHRRQAARRQEGVAT
jgi:hypothetical protein